MFLFNRVSNSLSKRGKKRHTSRMGGSTITSVFKLWVVFNKRLIEWVHELNEVICYKSSVQISAELLYINTEKGVTKEMPVTTPIEKE